MAIDLQAIAEALATNLRTVTGDIQVTPFLDDLIPADADWISAEIAPKDGEGQVNAERALVTGETYVLAYQVTLYLAMVDAEAAQKRMLAFMGFGSTSSVWDALNSDLVLGGLAQKILAGPSHSYVSIQRANQRLIKNVWDVRVWASA